MPDKNEIAVAIAQQLAAFERHLDQTLALGSNLLAALPQARLDLRLAAGADGGAIGHVLASLDKLGHARQHTVEGHRALDVVRRALGLPPVAIGDKLDFVTRGELEAGAGIRLVA